MVNVVVVAVKTAAAPLRGRLRRALTDTTTTHQRGHYEEGPDLKPTPRGTSTVGHPNMPGSHATGRYESSQFFGSRYRMVFGDICSRWVRAAFLAPGILHRWMRRMWLSRQSIDTPPDAKPIS